MKEIITERPNLFEPNVYITMCVEIAGKICPHKLTAAIKGAYKANGAAMSGIGQNLCYSERNGYKNIFIWYSVYTDDCYDDRSAAQNAKIMGRMEIAL